MNNTQAEILAVPVSVEDIKASYSIMSRFYPVVEGLIEKGLRHKGLQLLAVTPGEVVLEVGFGTGYSLKEIASLVGENGKAYGIDITPEMVKTARKRLKKAKLIDRVELYEGDARMMPYQDSQFDAVYLASTLELFDTPDIPRVLKEIKRVLTPNGRLVVTSLTKEGWEDSLSIKMFMRFYEWLHKKIPKYANCRPIYVEKSVADAGYQITKTEEYKLLRIFIWRIVLAKPGDEQQKADAA